MQFQKFDTNKDGKIEAGEVVALLKALGRNVYPASVQNVNLYRTRSFA